MSVSVEADGIVYYRGRGGTNDICYFCQDTSHNWIACLQCLLGEITFQGREIALDGLVIHLQNLLTKRIIIHPERYKIPCVCVYTSPQVVSICWMITRNSSRTLCTRSRPQLHAKCRKKERFITWHLIFWTVCLPQLLHIQLSPLGKNANYFLKVENQRKSSSPILHLYSLLPICKENFPKKQDGAYANPALSNKKPLIKNYNDAEGKQV